jgi:hypothetical protein
LPKGPFSHEARINKLSEYRTAIDLDLGRALLKGRKGEEFVTIDIVAAIDREGFWGKSKP